MIRSNCLYILIAARDAHLYRVAGQKNRIRSINAVGQGSLFTEQQNSKPTLMRMTLVVKTQMPPNPCNHRTVWRGQSNPPYRKRRERGTEVCQTHKDISGSIIGQTHSDTTGPILSQTHNDTSGSVIGHLQCNPPKVHLLESQGAF